MPIEKLLPEQLFFVCSSIVDSPCSAVIHGSPKLRVLLGMVPASHAAVAQKRTS